MLAQAAIDSMDGQWVGDRELRVHRAVGEQSNRQSPTPPHMAGPEGAEAEQRAEPPPRSPPPGPSEPNDDFPFLKDFLKWTNKNNNFKVSQLIVNPRDAGISSRKRRR